MIEAKVGEGEYGMKGIVRDQRVIDFVRGINQLNKDTGLSVLSSDYREAMLKTPEGKLYFVCKDVGEENYHAETADRQGDDSYEATPKSYLLGKMAGHTNEQTVTAETE